MTDEQIRALCLEAATKNHTDIPCAGGRGRGGGDIMSDAERMFQWVKTGKLSYVIAVGSGGGGGETGRAGSTGGAGGQQPT